MQSTGTSYDVYEMPIATDVHMFPSSYFGIV